MLFSLIIWSFVSAFCLYQFITIGGLYSILFGGGFFISLYMWIYALIYIIRTDFPVQVKVNIDTKINKNERNNEL